MTVYILCLDLAYDGINILGVYTTYHKAVDAAILRSVASHVFNSYVVFTVGNVDDLAGVMEYKTTYFEVKGGQAVMTV
jgi:hypothetical protein